MQYALTEHMSTEQDKPLELEQVPLKSDTDAPAGTTEETTAIEAPPPAVTKKTWFFKKVVGFCTSTINSFIILVEFCEFRPRRLYLKIS